ncbi:hypothetical protein Btru_055276 [Bulinus truncatus]|nr:hypothetical protein Btru_055276 [Bulinus truncatus]
MTFCKHSEHSTQDDYKEHITSRLEQYRVKCSKINDCIETLRRHENPLVLLYGEDIKLRTICRFSANTPRNYSNIVGQCTEQERDEIANELDDHLKAAIKDRPELKSIDDCLAHQPAASRVEQICRLVEKQDKICSPNGEDVHTKIQSFINAELQDINCICKELKSQETQPPLPLAVYIGLGIFFITFVIIGLVIWYKKYKCRRSRKEELNHVYEVVSGTYDQLNLKNNCSQEERVISQEGPSVMSTTWSIISTGNSPHDVEKAYSKLIDPDCQTFYMNKLNILSTLRDFKDVPSTPGRPAGDCTIFTLCPYCRLEQLVDVSQENRCQYCHAAIDFGRHSSVM